MPQVLFYAFGSFILALREPPAVKNEGGVDVGVQKALSKKKMG